MDYDSFYYDNPWRTNYESQAFGAWVAAGFVSFGINKLSALPPEPFYWMGGICGIMAAARLPQAYRLYNLQKHLTGRELEFISTKQLVKDLRKNSDSLWLGHGFVWENRHAQRVFEIMKRDWSEVVDNSAKRVKSRPLGQPWIHGVEPNEHKLYQAISHTEGQNLLLGTTGSGKTRLFDLLIAQAIMRGDCVIVLDPKSDHELKANAQRICEELGEPGRFLHFHPGFPEDSIRINPLQNYSRATEIASRIAALIPSEAGADPFKAFGWQALNNVVQSLVMIDETPTLVSLKRYLESGPEVLVVRAVEAYTIDNLPQYKPQLRTALSETNGTLLRQAKAMTKFYKEVVQPEAPSPALDGLISMFLHDNTHYSKMVASLIPILSMLTAGNLQRLLSPDEKSENRSDPSDQFNKKSLITDTKQIIAQRKVLYCGLDSLSDGVTGSAIGSILLSDLVSVAGDRYNFGVGDTRVSIFIDEAAEVINEPTIQLLNKGRGSKMTLTLASQTINDIEARLGNKAKAMQVLGNLNNVISLRVIDPDTQAFVAENFPKTRLKHVMRTQGMSSRGDTPAMFSSNQGERLMEEEGELFPQQLLGMLPNLEYIAKISGGTILKGRLPILTG